MMEKQIKEDEIKETVHTEDRKVRDIDWTIELGSSQQKTIETKVLSVPIDAFIIATNKQCAIFIDFLEIPSINVFNEMQFSGTKYIPIRLQSFVPTGELLNPGSSKMLLNNALTITVQGSRDTIVNITLRY